MFALLAAAMGIGGPGRPEPPEPSPVVEPPAEVGERTDRRRRGFYAYHADAWGDRLVGYDGTRRECWVERLDRPVELERVRAA